MHFVMGRELEGLHALVTGGGSGIGAAAMGKIADISGISFVYQICSFLPLLGILTILLPDVEERAGN